MKKGAAFEGDQKQVSTELPQTLMAFPTIPQYYVGLPSQGLK